MNRFLIRLKAIVVILLLTACASSEKSSEEGRYEAQWIGAPKFEFSSALRELYQRHVDDTQLFDKSILPSSIDTYREILARKEVGLPFDDLKEQKKQVLSIQLPNFYRSFIEIELGKYDQVNRGFKLDNIRLVHRNPSIEMTQSCNNNKPGSWMLGRNANCFPVVAPDYGVTSSIVNIDTSGWILPVLPENAVKYLKQNKYSQASKLEEEKSTYVNIMFTFKIKDCNSVGTSKISCNGALNSGELYGSDRASSTEKPLNTLVKI